jgi:hypothetical protein
MFISVLTKSLLLLRNKFNVNQVYIYLRPSGYDTVYFGT